MSKFPVLFIGFGICCCLFAPTSAAFNYGVDKIRGANLGAWLVLEKWMTPGVFEGLPDSVVDEFTLCKYLGKVEAEKRLRKHWDTFITENDIKALKDAGLNHLRLPIGYWALDNRPDDPYVAGSWDYVGKAVAWAKKYGMQVMIGLHGVPGSQNGNDHSGHAGEIKFYYDDENLNRAAKVLGIIAGAFGKPEWKDTVTILQTVNEPIISQDYDFRLKKLKQYNSQAYDEIRKFNKDIIVCIHDAFIDLSNWFYFRDDPHFSRVMLDTHIYQVFGDNWKSFTCEKHLTQPCTQMSRLSAGNAKLWTVVGEWSLATVATNGPCKNQIDFARQQIGAYEKSSSGWFFWSAKHALGWVEWSFMDAQKAGFFNLKTNNVPKC